MPPPRSDEFLFVGDLPGVSRLDDPDTSSPRKPGIGLEGRFVNYLPQLRRNPPFGARIFLGNSCSNIGDLQLPHMSFAILRPISSINPTFSIFSIFQELISWLLTEEVASFAEESTGSRERVSLSLSLSLSRGERKSKSEFTRGVGFSCIGSAGGDARSRFANHSRVGIERNEKGKKAAGEDGEEKRETGERERERAWRDTS
mgnify:CR=1 FL=1